MNEDTIREGEKEAMPAVLASHAATEQRVTELQEEVERLRAQVTALQAQGTDLVNEARKHRILAVAARRILAEVLIDVPMSVIVTRIDPEMGANMIRDMPAYREVSDRNALLESDAWTKCHQLAREFVHEVVEEYGDGSAYPHAEPELRMLVAWAKQFSAAL